MSNDRKNNALARIAAALDRFESLAERPLPSTGTDNETAAELASLAQRHAKLKEEATLALSALDAVISRAASVGGQS